MAVEGKAFHMGMEFFLEMIVKLIKQDIQRWQLYSQIYGPFTRLFCLSEQPESGSMIKYEGL